MRERKWKVFNEGWCLHSYTRTGRLLLAKDFTREQMSVRFGDADTEKAAKRIPSEGKKMVGSVTIPVPS